MLGVRRGNRKLVRSWRLYNVLRPLVGGGLAAAFYFLFIRPQQTRNRKQQELMRSLEIGDKVRTAGGIFGIILSIDETEVVLGVEEGRLRVARAAVQTRIEPEEPEDTAEGSES